MLMVVGTVIAVPPNDLFYYCRLRNYLKEQRNYRTGAQTTQTAQTIGPIALHLGKDAQFND